MLQSSEKTSTTLIIIKCAYSCRNKQDILMKQKPTNQPNTYMDLFPSKISAQKSANARKYLTYLLWYFVSSLLLKYIGY